MFNRAELKQKAKDNFHRNLWLCIGATFIVTFLSSDTFGIEVDAVTYETYFRMGLGTIGDLNFDFIYIPISNTIVTLVSLAALVINIFIFNPLSVGHARFYVDNRMDNASLETLFTYFNKESYLNVVKVLLLRDIYTVLWTLLFIIPGIIKSIEYSMIPFILAENPTMDSSEVFEVTKELTNGYKFDLFVLDFSFILWVLLVAFTFGIAALYVNPYIFATSCEAYYFLKEMAIEKGILAVDIKEEIEYVEPTIDDLH